MLPEFIVQRIQYESKQIEHSELGLYSSFKKITTMRSITVFDIGDNNCCHTGKFIRIYWRSDEPPNQANMFSNTWIKPKRVTHYCDNCGTILKEKI